MAEMLEVIENLRAEEASVKTLFGGEGRKVQGQSDPGKLVEAAKFIERVQKGRLPLHYMQEAMSTSDFPILFADILDRQMLGAYEATEPTWQAYCRRGVVPDFRNVKRFAIDGAESTLDRVEELEEYPEASLEESKDEYRVYKMGRRLALSWETLINDDLGAFTDIPARLARAARRTESKIATGLFVGPNGPHGTLYNASNTIPGNPDLSLDGLQAAMTLLSEQVDEDGEPIVVDMVTLVVPPALEIIAQNILNAVEIDLRTNGGSNDQRLRARNWMSNRVQLQVEPYIPHVAGTNGNSSWFLFANPNTGRPAIELGFLRGNEQPALYERLPNARRVGGSGDASESFEDDSRQWRVRHVLGGARLTSTGGRKATVASNGTGNS